MNKPYLVMLGQVLMSRHLTKHGALKTIERLRQEGRLAVLAYDISEGV